MDLLRRASFRQTIYIRLELDLFHNSPVRKKDVIIDFENSLVL